METVKLKKAIFTPTKIILLKKKGDIIIKAEDILNLKYTKLTLLNLLSGDPYVGSLRIILKSSLYQQNEYLVRLKFKDIFKLQPIYRDKIYKQLYPTYF